MKRFLIIFLYLCCMTGMYAQDCTPTRDIQETDSGIVVTYWFHGGILQDDPLHPGSKFWKIPGFGLNDTAGEPAFPFHYDTFAIPQGVIPIVEAIDSVYTDTAFVMAPAYPPLLLIDSIGYTTERVPEIIAYNGCFPSQVVSPNILQYYRGYALLSVGVMPVQYDYLHHVVRKYDMIRYFIKYIRTRQLKPVKKLSRDDNYVSNTALNYTEKQRGRDTGQESCIDNRDYLVLTTAEYGDSIEHFAEGKRLKGFRVTVESRNTWENSDSVKNFIKHFYENSCHNLYYVFIIGNHNQVPPEIKEFHSMNDGIITYMTDYYYACMGDSTDVTQDIGIGRCFSVNTLEKTIEYEYNPVLNQDFYKKALHASFFEDKDLNGCEDNRLMETSESIKTVAERKGKTIARVYNKTIGSQPMCWNDDIYNMNYGVFNPHPEPDSIPAEIRDINFNWNKTGTDITRIINEGAFYVLYSGHGWPFAWDKPWYNSDSICTLHNEHKNPVVFSMSCLTGKYREADCFTRTFLAGRWTGAVAVFASTEIQYMGKIDALSEGLFDAFWPDSTLHYSLLGKYHWTQHEPVYDLGGMLRHSYSHNVISQTPYSSDLYCRAILHCFGDPSMMIYTDRPQRIIQPYITYMDNHITVSTKDGDSRITFYTPSTNQVDSYIGNHVEYETTADSVIVCLDRHNYIPYIQKCYKTIFVQDEVVSDTCVYVGKQVLLGNHVTNEKPQGDVIINNGNVTIQGGRVVLCPGTKIVNSKVKINLQE